VSTPIEVLASARAVLADTDHLGLARPRSVAVLARHALEQAIADDLRQRAPGSQAANFTVQLICLQYMHPNRELTRRVAWTWSALSAATHHHGYELAPSTIDLERWLDTVAAFIES
jgi:hypothetical protein